MGSGCPVPVVPQDMAKGGPERLPNGGSDDGDSRYWATQQIVEDVEYSSVKIDSM